MNCNVFILQDCRLQIKGNPRDYQATKGEVITGTAKEGRVLFHVTSKANGKIYPVWLTVNDFRIRVEMFKNQSE